MKTVKLGEITKQINGLWKGKKEPFVNVGVIRNANFTKECTLELSDVVYLDVQKNQFASRKLQKGDLIIEKSGGSDKCPVGRAVPFELEAGDYSFSNFTSVLRIINPQEVNYKYLHRYLLYLYKSGYMKSLQSNTIGLHNLDFDKYKEILVPLPPLSEQTRIVSLLDDAFGKLERSREKALKLLDDAKEIFQAQLKKEMTPKEGWEVKKIKEVFSLKAGKTIKASELSQELREGYYPCFGGNGFRGYIAKKTHEGSHIIIGRQGALCGNVNIARGEFYATEHAVVVTNKQPVNFRFAFLALKAMDLNQYSTGAAQPGLSVNVINELNIAIPSIKEQINISHNMGSLMSQLKQIEEKTNKYLADLDELKQSLLKKAFEGKL